MAFAIPSTDEDDEPWAAPPSRRRKEPPIEGELPASVEVVLGNQVYIDRSKLPPGLVNRIVRLAAFQNPEFYAAQAMRLPTFGKPRIISCAELFSKTYRASAGMPGLSVSLFGCTGHCRAINAMNAIRTADRDTVSRRVDA